jgi:hypothetical protein
MRWSRESDAKVIGIDFFVVSAGARGAVAAVKGFCIDGRKGGTRARIVGIDANGADTSEGGIGATPGEFVVGT